MFTIHISPPKNVSGYSYLFFKRSYKIFPLKILEARNVTVTSDGICFHNSEIIKESVQAIPDKVRIFELSGNLQLKTSPTIHLQDKKRYLLIFHPWINYYHWLTESVPRLWLARDILNEVVVLLPESYKKLKYVQESILPFNLKNIEYFPDGNNIKVRNAIIPQIKPICSYYHPDVVCNLRRFYVEFAKNICKDVPIKNDRLYILRGNSMRRRIINENEVLEVLDKFNFLSVDATSFAFLDQVVFSDHARFLVSNGSGLTNMHFMRSGTSVMELQKRITNLNDFHDRVLWHLSSVLKINYYYFICDPVNKQEDLYHANLKINTKNLENRIKEFLEK